jgi:hypothetical protein
MASDRRQAEEAGVSGPLPMAVYEAAVRVCGESLHWKNMLKKLFVRAGVREQGFEWYRTLSKFVIARSVLVDLEHVGLKGWKVQRRFVAELPTSRSRSLKFQISGVARKRCASYDESLSSNMYWSILRTTHAIVAGKKRQTASLLVAPVTSC